MTNLNPPEASPPAARRDRGEKRELILHAAAERFGRDGYEETKWADIARDVGVGPTALYHYFESKQHCLFELMETTLGTFRTRFDERVASEPEPRAALAAVLNDTFALGDHEVLRNRLLVAEQGLLSNPRSSPREERARQSARSRMHDIEFAWATFLARCMQHGVVPDADPRLLTRAVLGLYTSIWHWYRPGGPLGLEDLRGFFLTRAFDMLGVRAADPAPVARTEALT